MTLISLLKEHIRQKLKKLGVKADGMTVTVPQAASGETLDATVHMVNIGGVENNDF